MKIKSVSISNFRSYSKEVKIDFQDLTAIVGKTTLENQQFLKLCMFSSTMGKS